MVAWYILLSLNVSERFCTTCTERSWSINGSRWISTMDNNQKRNITFFTIGLIFMLSGIEYGEFMMTSFVTCGLACDHLWKMMGKVWGTTQLFHCHFSCHTAYDLEVSADSGGTTLLFGSGSVCLQPERAADWSSIWVLVRSKQNYKIHHPFLQPIWDCWSVAEINRQITQMKFFHLCLSFCMLQIIGFSFI